jgi:hypothetical protein
MLTLSVIFLTLDFYYACWIYQLRHKFPQHISEYISKALYGFGADMVSVLRKNLRGLPENIRKNREKIAEDVMNLRGKKKKREVETSGRGQEAQRVQE